jgi:hypothetical protein
VRDLTGDGRLSTHDKSVLKLSKVSFRGKCARMGNPLKLPSPTKLANKTHFSPASQTGHFAGPVFHTISFLWFAEEKRAGRGGGAGLGGECGAKKWGGGGVWYTECVFPVQLIKHNFT